MTDPDGIADVSYAGLGAFLKVTYEVGKDYLDRPVVASRDGGPVFWLDSMDGRTLWLHDVLVSRHWGMGAADLERLEATARVVLDETLTRAKDSSHRLTHVNGDARELLDRADEKHWSRQDYLHTVHNEAMRADAKDRVEGWRAEEQAAKHREDWDSLFLDEADLGELVVPPALVEGVLPRGSNAILRGRDGTYKTFVALDWALHIAAGRSWQGHGTEQGPVLYVAGEGAFGIRDRVAAWRAFHKYTEPLPFTLRRSALNFHAPGEPLDHLLSWVEERKVQLVVLDTLRRISGGAEGNGSEMGRVIDSIDRVKAAMNAVGGSTLTLTHTDKGDNDTRGFSGIEDDIDVVFHAKREESTPFVTLLNTKQKDGPELAPLTLVAEPTGESLVLSAAMGAGRAGAEARILTYLTYETDEKDEGETAAMIMARTKIAKRTVIDALDRMVARGDLVLTHETRPKKYAAAASLARFIGGVR